MPLPNYENWNLLREASDVSERFPCIAFDDYLLEATSFEMWVEEAIGFATDQNTKDFLIWAKDNTPNETFAVDAIKVKDGSYSSKQLVIKCNHSDNIKPIVKWINSQKDSPFEAEELSSGNYRIVIEKQDPTAKPDKIMLKVSGKNLGRSGNTPTTEQHELMTLVVFEKFIENGFGEIESFMKELEAIYPDIENLKGWTVALRAQGLALKKYIGPNNGFSYYRDSGLAGVIISHAKKLGVRKKDTWNPADVWMVKNEAKHKRAILKIDDLKVLNAYLVSGVNNKELIPISLKKTKETASVTEVNIENSAIDSPLKINKVEIDLNFDKTKKKFRQNGSEITMQNSAKFQGRFATRKQFVVEGSMKGSVAQLGKVPINSVRNAINNPMQWSAWDGKFDSLGTLEKMYTFLQGHKLVQTRASNSYEEFEEGMKILFNDKVLRYDRYMQKCLAMEFVYGVLTTKNPEITMTKFFLYAQKQGDDFGPFIKIS